MRIGINLPQFGATARHIEETTRFAADAEERGAASLWVGDRLFAAVDPRVWYPGTESVPEQFRAVHDPLTLLTAAAAVTSRVRLGTSTLNAPWYPAAALARQATTIDGLSGGRLLLGLGTGWAPEEYEAVGVPMRERGDRLDETLDVLQHWWNDDPVSYEGRFVTVPPSHVQVKPHGIPLYLAGFAPRARRRIATRADGFLPMVTTGVTDLDAAISKPWAELREEAVAAGRPADAIDAVLRVNPLPGSTAADVAETLRRVREQTDVQHAFVDLMYVAFDHAAYSRMLTEILDAVG